jgi:hypothetical protein
VFVGGTPQADSLQTLARVSPRIKSLLQHAIPGTQDLLLVVELTDPGVLEKMRGEMGGIAATASLGQGQGRMRLDTPKAISYRAQLGRTQSQMMTRFRALSGVQVEGSTDLVLNSIFVRAPVEQYEAIRQMSGVKKVYFSRTFHRDLNAAKTVVNAPGLWSSVNGGQTNAGAGERIGFIDDGIDITNPMFADSTPGLPTSAPPGFPVSDTSTDKLYTNHKVIAARNYVLTKYGYTAQSVADVRDEYGHGTFVAGCAAGKLVTAADSNVGQISGMAPAAFIGAYKVFGTPGINDGATTPAIVQALNDAVSDGMNVVSLSLGSLDYLPSSESPEVTAVENAISHNVVVVIAAGNEGPGPDTVSTPGSAPDAITVGAAWNSRALGPGLHVVGPGSVPTTLQYVSYVSGSGAAISTAISSTSMSDVATLDGTGLACSSLPSAGLSGKIALIERGTCTFSTKVTNAVASGARAVIVYDNNPGEPPAVMSLSGSTPAVMISYSDGLLLKSFAAANSGSALVSIDVSTVEQSVPTTPGILAYWSSRGPSADFNIKPDILAVGVDVYSATQSLWPSQGLGSATKFTYGNGTSFATPMVSGAAADILQLFPTLTPAGVKSVLVNTATQNGVTTDGTTQASVIQAGGGLLNMGSAAAAGAVFSPATLNFGANSYSGSITLTLPLTITNISSSSDQYTISSQALNNSPPVSLSPSSTGPVASSAQTTVNVTVHATTPATGGYQGYITVQSTRTSMTYTVPYWAGIYVPDSTRILKVSQSTTGSNIFSNLNDAVAAANPGNIIEIEDSQTYSLPSSSDSTTLPSISISTNAQGLPLHGVTIRAAAGQTPTLDGSNASAYADIQVVGVRGVLIQGLTINSGNIGVDVYQGGTSEPTSVTIDHCTLSNQATGTYSLGVYVENGGDVSITDSTVSGSVYAGVYAMGPGRLTVSGSTIQTSQGDGLDAINSNVDLISSTFTGNGGEGVACASCTGTLTKSTFSNNTTPGTGDGLDLYDASDLTITGNTFSGNGSAGIYLDLYLNTTGGPIALITRNTFQSNSEVAIMSVQAQSLQIVGNLIKDNGIGFYARNSTTAFLANNIILRSNYSGSPPEANGVDVGGTSSVSLVNNTIYKCQSYGIQRYTTTGSPTLSVYNTIVAQSGTKDLSGGVVLNNVTYSFVADGSGGSGTNFSGDPKFNNVSADDYSLATGSLAIDHGSNAVPNLPFLDYNQQLRVASVGALPGSGTEDIGALEANSSYPINYPLLASGLISKTSTGFYNNSYVTGFAAVNPSTSSPTQALFTAYDATGSPFSGQTATNTVSITPEAHYAGLDFQLFGYTSGASKLGAVLASSAQKLVGFFLMFDPLFANLADGVDVSSDTYTDLYFMRHEFDSSGLATYQLFNPGINTANITANVLSTGGNALENPKTYSIPPKGQYLFSFNSTPTSSGYVYVHSDRPITGLETFGNSTDIAALRAAPAGTEARLFFPHFVVNGPWSSLVGIVNTGAVTANLTLTAYGDDGSILGATAHRTVSANGQLLESPSSLFGLSSGSIIDGYIVVTSDQPGITGFNEFSYTSGNIYSVSAVPSESVPQPLLIFSHIANQVASGRTNDPYLTGIALLNPYGTTVGYDMKVLDGSGNQIAENIGSLGPYQKVSRLLSWPTPGAAFFTQSIQLGSGHIEVTALDPTTGAPGYQLLGFEMFFTQSGSMLAAVMAQFPN